MPSAMVWTLGWGVYFGWIMRETWSTRKLEAGYIPIHLSDQYNLKGQYLRAKALIEKYDAELDKVDKENPSADDIQKFELTRPSVGYPFWMQFVKNPFWRKIDAEARSAVHRQMIEEHPEYETLAAARQEGIKKLFALPGPWMKANYDNGLHGLFDGYAKRVAHHGPAHEDHGHGKEHH